MAARLQSIATQLAPAGGINALTQKNPDDVVITLAIRTPLTKGGKGGFKDTPVDGIVVKLLKEVVSRSKIDPALVEDICLGNVRRPVLHYIKKQNN
jgi:acetyl-CoA acyltransferase 1